MAEREAAHRAPGAGATPVGTRLPPPGGWCAYGWAAADRRRPWSGLGSFGDVLANACVAKGLGGLVTDTGVRDTQELRKLGFPVFSTVGPMAEPVLIGGEIVRPGDVVRADAGRRAAGPHLPEGIVGSTASRRGRGSRAASPPAPDRPG
ncbi:RraA family protein [Streptomyces asiaticus]